MHTYNYSLPLCTYCENWKSDKSRQNSQWILPPWGKSYKFMSSKRFQRLKASFIPDDFKVVSKGYNGLNDIYSEFEGIENEVWSPYHLTKSFFLGSKSDQFDPILSYLCAWYHSLCSFFLRSSIMLLQKVLKDIGWAFSEAQSSNNKILSQYPDKFN